jgi:hypothetical protein
MKPMDYKELGKRISKLTVKDIHGKEVELASLWSDRRIVLVFLRHFG